MSLPRMRGDRPEEATFDFWKTMFTPHARGSTLGIATGEVADDVYPACAGIDPHLDLMDSIAHSLPRMRGDRPVS